MRTHLYYRGTLDTLVCSRVTQDFHPKYDISSILPIYDHTIIDNVDSVYIYDVKKVVSLFKKWKTMMPDIQPYYAIKCNPDPVVLDALANAGACFDAASPKEIQAALDRVPPERIIYANPCKSDRDINFAARLGVSLTVFDNMYEYEKIAQVAPSMSMLLRIYASDQSAQCVLSNKYGATADEWCRLLQNISPGKLTGVSFHIGSGANDPQAFVNAIRTASSVFDIATSLGFRLDILDIGGGFTHSNIDRMAPHVNMAINDFKKSHPNTHIIAEPGRYFVESVADLYTKVIGVRARVTDDKMIRNYWINDSLYGSFNCILYDHAQPVPHALTQHGEPMVDAVIWGSTCDGFDKIIDNAKLPILSIGDWIQWKNMGAYTQAGASHFNGIPFADVQKVYIHQ